MDSLVVDFVADSVDAESDQIDSSVPEQVLEKAAGTGGAIDQWEGKCFRNMVRSPVNKMKLLSFAGVLLISADKMALNMVHGLKLVFCWFISIPSYDILNNMALPDMASYLVHDILACIIQTLLACRFSRSCFICYCTRCFLSYVRSFITATFGLEGCCMCYAENGTYIWSAVLDFCYGVGAHLQGAVRSDCLLLDTVVLDACKGFSGGPRSCRQKQFIEEHLATTSKRLLYSHLAVEVRLELCLALPHVCVDFGPSCGETSFNYIGHLSHVCCCRIIRHGRCGVQELWF